MINLRSVSRNRYGLSRIDTLSNRGYLVTRSTIQGLCLNNNERAKKVLTHARDDEKEHVGEFLALLEILDPRQAEYIKKGKVEITELLEGK